MLTLETLNITRYEVQLRARAEAVLPPFLGSALRGAFGHALKTIACSVKHGDCSRCLLVERCLYPRLFETTAGNERPEAGHNGNQNQDDSRLVKESSGSLKPDTVKSTVRSRLLKNRQAAPRPFIFVPPLPASEPGFTRACDDFLRWRVRVKPGESVCFGLTLFGEAIRELPYIIYAISLMVQNGFGAARSPFELEKVFAVNAQGNRKLIYHRDDERITKHGDCLYTLATLTEIRLAELALNRATADSKTVGIGGAKPFCSQSTRMHSELIASAHIDKALFSVWSVTSPNNGSALGQAIGKGQTFSTQNSELAEQPIGNWQSTIGNELTLRFLTPTRLRIKGRVVEHPTFSQLVSSISLRLAILAETWGSAPLVYDYKTMMERATEVSTRHSTLRLMSLDRFSSRRHGKLELDGFMGDITFAGPAIQDLLPLLVAGEFLHVGSVTAFGLGRYVIG